jgi:CubicO group peptidase (beta-lactamase class C family)
MTSDTRRWQTRLDELARDHEVPGASLAILDDGALGTAVTGVLNIETGVEVTPDSLFQIASVTKPYTATVVMRQVEAGRMDLDAPVTAVLPEFKVADPHVTARVTARDLLTHTSGIAGDYFPDTGRGDDALERFVETLATLGQDVPMGATVSYSNTGYSILGRMVERLTGTNWEAAMRQELFEPLGLKHTVALPEDALRFRTAWGHIQRRGEPPSLQGTSYWARSLAPAGVLCASAADVVRFARLFMDGGATESGTRLLSRDLVDEMLRPQAAIPDRWTLGDHWALGWIVGDWDGQRVYGHLGGLPGVKSFLHVAPERGVAVALLTNGSAGDELGLTLIAELLEELCDIRVPPWPEPAPDAAVDRLDNVAGDYERHGVRLELTVSDGRLRAVERIVEPLRSSYGADLPEETEELVRPSTAGADVFVVREGDEGPWLPLVFFTHDGERYVHTGARAFRSVG